MINFGFVFVSRICCAETTDCRRFGRRFPTFLSHSPSACSTGTMDNMLKVSSHKPDAAGLQTLPDLVFQQNLLTKLAQHEKAALMRVCRDLRLQVLRCTDPVPWACFAFLGRDKDMCRQASAYHTIARDAAGKFGLHVGGCSLILRKSTSWDNRRNIIATRILKSTNFNALTTLHLQGLRLTMLIPPEVAQNCPNLTTLGLENCVLAPSNIPVRRLPSQYPSEGDFSEKHYYLDETFLQVDEAEASSVGMATTGNTLSSCSATTTMCTKLTHLSVKKLTLEWPHLSKLFADYVRANIPVAGAEFNANFNLLIDGPDWIDDDEDDHEMAAAAVIDAIQPAPEIGAAAAPGPAPPPPPAQAPAAALPAGLQDEMVVVGNQVGVGAPGPGAGGGGPAAAAAQLPVNASIRHSWKRAQPHQRLLVLSQILSEKHGVTDNPFDRSSRYKQWARLRAELEGDCDDADNDGGEPAGPAGKAPAGSTPTPEASPTAAAVAKVAAAAEPNTHASISDGACQRQDRQRRGKDSDKVHKKLQADRDKVRGQPIESLLKAAAQLHGSLMSVDGVANKVRNFWNASYMAHEEKLAVAEALLSEAQQQVQASAAAAAPPTPSKTGPNTALTCHAAHEAAAAASSSANTATGNNSAGADPAQPPPPPGPPAESPATAAAVMARQLTGRLEKGMRQPAAQVNPIKHVPDAWQPDAVPVDSLCAYTLCAPDALKRLGVFEDEHRRMYRDRYSCPLLLTSLYGLEDLLTCLRVRDRMAAIQQTVPRLKALQEWQITQDLPRQLLALPNLEQLLLHDVQEDVTRALCLAVGLCNNNNAARTSQHTHNDTTRTPAVAAAPEVASKTQHFAQGEHIGRISMGVSPQPSAFQALTSIALQPIDDACMQMLVSLPQLRHVTGTFNLTKFYNDAPCKWHSIRVLLRCANGRPRLCPCKQYHQLAALPLSSLQSPLELAHWGLPVVCVISNVPQDMWNFNIGAVADETHIETRLRSLREAAENVAKCKHGIRWVLGDVHELQKDAAWVPGRRSFVHSTSDSFGERHRLADMVRRTRGRKPETMHFVVEHRSGNALTGPELRYLHEWFDLFGQDAAGSTIAQEVGVRTAAAASKSFLSTVFSCMTTCEALKRAKVFSLVGCSKFTQEVLPWVVPALPDTVASVKIRYSVQGRFDKDIRIMISSVTRPIKVLGMCGRYVSAYKRRWMDAFAELCSGNAHVSACVVEPDPSHEEDTWRDMTGLGLGLINDVDGFAFGEDDDLGDDDDADIQDGLF